MIVATTTPMVARLLLSAANGTVTVTIAPEQRNRTPARRPIASVRSAGVTRMPTRRVSPGSRKLHRSHENPLIRGQRPACTGTDAESGTQNEARGMFVDHWRVQKRGSTLRIDADPGAVEHVDEMAAEIGREVDDSIHVVRVTGGLLDEPHRGATALLRRVGTIALERGKHFQVGPI
jgi:hypothetical protein